MQVSIDHVRSRIVGACRPLYHAAVESVIESRINRNGRGAVNLIDIGSAGLLPRPWVYRPALIRRLLKFDPRSESRRNPNIRTLDVAVWSENLRRPFYVYKGFGGAGSSLFRQNIDYVKANFDYLRTRGPRKLTDTWYERAELVETVEIECRCLDDVLQYSEPGTDYHLLKIDAQGAELAILQGARQLLEGSCLGLQLELFVLPLYEGAPLMDEVVAYLDSVGFSLAKKFPAHGTFDSQHDCLFLKKSVKDRVSETIRTVYRVA